MSNMVVNTNVLALNSHRALKGVGDQQSRASGRLSSGLRINSAADDAAGLAISEKMRAQIRGLDMASKNTQDGISLVQTAEGGMQEINNMLQRIRELIDYASNDTNEHNTQGTGDRQKIQDEINQMTQEIDSMAERVEFNKKRVINGSFADTKAALARATQIRDEAQLGKISADNRFTTLLNALTNQVDGAEKLLDDAQTALKTELNDNYSPALASFTTAQVKYQAAMREYEVAKNQLMDAMSTSNIANVNAITDAHISVGSKTYVGTAQATALISALNRYVTASANLGLDELGAGKTDVVGNLSDPNWSASFTSGNGSLGITPTSGVGTAGPTNVVESRSLTPLGGEMQAFATATASFQTAQINYNAKVNARDVAQSKVDTLNTMLTEARRDLTSANAKFNAADISFSAASNAAQENAGSPLHFQVGANANQSLIMSIGSVKTDILGIGDGHGNSRINVLKMTGADITAQLDILDQALSYVSTERSKLGAAQNRMEYTMKSLDISSENLSASESRVRDADMAKEMMNVTKANVLQQAAISMLAQANQAPQSVLQLLR